MYSLICFDNDALRHVNLFQALNCISNRLSNWSPGNQGLLLGLGLRIFFSLEIRHENMCGDYKKLGCNFAIFKRRKKEKEGSSLFFQLTALNDD